MIPIQRAFRFIERETPRLGAERVEIAEVPGRILAEHITADTDLPPFDRSQMDGFALAAADIEHAPVELGVVGESAAGRGWHKTLKRGEAVRIMTGAPVPAGADAVQKLELTQEKKGVTVRILEPANTGQHIVRKAAEITKGSVIFKSGEAITENMIASMASFGYHRVRVAKRPRVAILGTGSEIVPVDKRPGRDQIRNSNSVMLRVLCERFNAQVTLLPIVRDEISNLKSKISDAVKSCDVLVITGGVSVGKYDHTKTALAELGAEIFFDKLRLKPGKPAVFARLKRALVFGLAGNPVSAAVTFHLLVRKALLKLQGAADTGLRTGHAVLGAQVKAAQERDTYLPSRIETGSDGQLVAHPLKWQGSSDFIGFARADSFIFVPRGQRLAKGEVAQIAFL